MPEESVTARPSPKLEFATILGARTAGVFLKNMKISGLCRPLALGAALKKEAGS